MSKKHKRGRLEPFKPQPAICSCDQGKLCEEVKDLRHMLELQRLDTECYKRLYSTSLDTQINVTRKLYALRAFKDETKSKIISTQKELNRYRRAFNVMRIINIIFTVGFAVMTAILIWS